MLIELRWPKKIGVEFLFIVENYRRIAYHYEYGIFLWVSNSHALTSLQHEISVDFFLMRCIISNVVCVRIYVCISVSVYLSVRTSGFQRKNLWTQLWKLIIDGVGLFYRLSCVSSQFRKDWWVFIGSKKFAYILRQIEFLFFKPVDPKSR